MRAAPLFEFDRGLRRRFTAGADEAGRGCLAGPLVVAAVMLDHERITECELEALGALNDSKRLSPQQRAELYGVVLAVATRVTVVVRTADEIDRSGLHKTNLSALREALARTARSGCICLSDGFAVGDVGAETLPVVRGDATSASIAAASIVAKVTRDRFMTRVAAEFDRWAFDEHFGYSTPEHRRRIQLYGVSPIHRRSFRSVAYEQLALGV